MYSLILPQRKVARLQEYVGVTVKVLEHRLDTPGDILRFQHYVRSPLPEPLQFLATGGGVKQKSMNTAPGL